MSNLAPLVSIGVPVFNSEATIKAALDSLISQTYSNIEIIISDNASTDLTADICREYALRDDRISLYQQTENLGVTHNFDFVLKASRGEYFMWAAGDDVRSTDFVTVNVRYLIANPEYVASTSLDNLTNFLDTHKSPFKKDGANYSLEGSIRDHFRFFFKIFILSHGLFYGLIRTEELKRCPYVSLPLFWAWDFTVSLYLIVIGKINVSEYGFTKFGTRETNPTMITWPAGLWRLLPFYKFSKIVLHIIRDFSLQNKLFVLLWLIKLNIVTFLTSNRFTHNLLFRPMFFLKRSLGRG